jgi:hypothetical protein
VLIDYGFEAPELYSPARPMGTLASFHQHWSTRRPRAFRQRPAGWSIRATVT